EPEDPSEDEHRGGLDRKQRASAHSLTVTLKLSYQISPGAYPIRPGLPRSMGYGSSTSIVHASGSGDAAGQTLPRIRAAEPSLRTSSFTLYQVSICHGNSTSFDSRFISAAQHRIWIFWCPPIRSST